MKISAAGVQMICQFEGYSARQYRDSVGVLTIGYGTTEADVSPLPTYLTQQQAADLLERKLNEKYGPPINALSLPLSQNQFDSLISLLYNVGPGIIGPSHTIGQKLRQHDWQGAADSFLLYDHAGGQVLLGLKRRREAERALFLKAASHAPKPNPLDVLTSEERHEVDRFDHYNQHPHLHHHALGLLRQKMTVLRKQIWLAAVKGISPTGGSTTPGWNTHNRRQRYEILLERTR